MAQLHEVLAAEKTITSAAAKMFTESQTKFQKPDSYFNGHVKSLQMIVENGENTAIEKAAAENKPVITDVVATLQYFFGYWAKSENLLASKNITNTTALADINFGSFTIPKVPVDELLGLEVRLEQIRNLFVAIPTLDASKSWTLDKSIGNNIYRAAEEHTSKTEKTMIPVVMSPATDKHPAQIEKVNKDSVIGTFTVSRLSGALSSASKARLISNVDGLIVAIKEARQRANTATVINSHIGTDIASLLMNDLVQEN